MSPRRRPSAPPSRPAPPAAPSGSRAAPSGSRLAIDALIAGPHTREAVDAFVAAHGFPIVEGASITFVYRGDAEAVHLKHWVYGLPSSQQLARVSDTDLWYLTLALPTGSRVEYKLEVVRGGHGEWINDPLNPNRAGTPDRG